MIARLFLGGRVVACVTLLVVAGCKREAPDDHKTKPVPTVSLVSPMRGTIHWTVCQPGRIEAYEETAIVPKIPGYVGRWNVDIGDRVKKGDVLAVLRVPDLVKELEQKRAEVEQARKLFQVAQAHVASSSAFLEEARASRGRYQSALTFRDKQHRRVNQLLNRSAISKEVEEESLNELRASEAGVKEVDARVERADADRMESEAIRDKCRVDIDVAQSAMERLQTLVDYATLTAPFDGVVTRRSINTGDFVQPPPAQQAPVYVVQRRELVRVFVDVPEADAVWIMDEAVARITVPSLKGRVFDSKVRRTAFSLRPQSRTLVAEIDLPNPDDLLRAGMYAYANLQAERAGVLSLPSTAVATQGDVNEGYQDYCFVPENGKVWRMFIEVGARGEGRVQVLKKKVRGDWEEFDGDEQVIRGDLSMLADGRGVKIDTNPNGPIRNSLTTKDHRGLAADRVTPSSLRAAVARPLNPFAERID